MKKHFIIPMTLLATTTTIGASLIANQNIVTNDIQSEAMDGIMAIPTKERADFGDILSNVKAGGEAIEIGFYWNEEEPITTTTDIVFTITERGESEPFETKELSKTTTPGYHYDSIVFEDLTPNTTYDILIHFSFGDGTGSTKYAHIVTNPIDIESTSAIKKNGTSIELTTNWKEAWTPASTKTILYSIATQDNPTNIIDSKFGTPPTDKGLQEDVVVFENLIPNENYIITTTITFADNKTLKETERITTIPSPTTPTINYIILENYSKGCIEIEVDFDEKNSTIDTTKSKIEIFEKGNENPPILKETIFLTEDVNYKYKSDVTLELNIDHDVKVTLVTDHDGTPHTITKTNSIKTIESTSSEIASLEITTNSNTFGKTDGSLNMEMDINQPTPKDINEIDIEIFSKTNKDFRIGLHLHPNTEEGTIAINETIENLPADTYGIIFNLETTNWSNNTSQTHEVTIAPTESTNPTISSTVGKPKSNDDGSETFESDSIRTTISSPTGTDLEANDVTGFVNYKVLDMEGNIISTPTSNTSLSNTDWDPENLQFSLNKDLIIPEAVVTTGYQIVLSGVEINYNLIDDISVDLNDALNGWAITGIVVGSIVGVALIGGGSYWIYSKNQSQS